MGHRQLTVRGGKIAPARILDRVSELNIEVDPARPASTRNAWSASTRTSPATSTTAACRAGCSPSPDGTSPTWPGPAPATWRRGSGRGGHDLADLLDDQADHLGRRDDALRAGQLRAERPGQPLHPGLRRHARVHRRLGAQQHGARRPSRCGLAPVHPHLRAHLRLPPTHPVDALYRAAGFEWGMPPDIDLAGVCDRYARLPLLFQPGTEWNYSVVHRRARPGRRGGHREAPRRVLDGPGSWSRSA